MKHRLPNLFAAATLLGGIFLLAALGSNLSAQQPPDNRSPVPASDAPGKPLDRPLPEQHLPEQHLPGQPLVAESARQLLLQPSLEAHLRQRLWLYGHQFLGSGLYRQLGPGPNKFLQWDLKMEVNGQITSLRQTSDRRHLWIHRNFPGKNTLSLIDLRRVEEAQAQAPGPPLPHAAPGALGGLPALLSGLDHYFQFPVARPDRLGDYDVWVVEGDWKPESLIRLLPAYEPTLRAGRLPPLNLLPPHLPHHVVLVLGRDPVLPLFPYRIEFLRQPEPTGQEGSPGKQVGGGRSEVDARNGADGRAGAALPTAERQPLLLMEFFEIRRAQLTPDQFFYEPGDNRVVDETDQVLERLGLKSPSP